MTQTNNEAPDTGKRSGGVNARVVLLAVKRHPLALLGVVFLAAGAAAAVHLFIPLPKATAATVFQIPAPAPVILDPTLESRVDHVTFKQTQVTLLKRRSTLNSILKQPAVQNLAVVRNQFDAATWLDNALKVEFRTSNELMRVSIEGDNADDLLTILDAVGKGFLAASEDRDHVVRRERLAKLEDLHRGFRAEWERSQKQLDAAARDLGARDGPTLNTFESKLKDDWRDAIRKRTVAREELADLELLGTVPGGGGKVRPGDEMGAAPTEEVEAEMRKDAGYKELEAAVVRAGQALEAAKAPFVPGERHPTILKAETELAAAKQKRDKYLEELRPQVESSLRRKGLPVPRTSAAVLKKKIEQADVQIADFERKLEKINARGTELETIKTEVGRAERQCTRYAEEIERIKLELDVPGRITHVKLSEEPFMVPGLQGNRRMKYTLLAALGVLVVGFAAVVLWEQRSQRLTDPSEVTTALGVRLIGSVPTNRGPGNVGEPHPVLVEAIDATRMMLMNGAHDSDLRVLVVTSAVSGEGKTSLSGHLAISLARAGFRTLLVDGDLRAPTSQRVFGLPLAPGLCEVLKGEIGAAAAARPTGVPNLSVLTAGEWSLATRQALAGDGWRVAKAQLKAEFDFVVVDTSPLLLVSDTLLLAREADGVVVSVLMGVSQVALVNEALNRLHTVRAMLTGVIANGVRSVAHEYTRRPESAAAALPVSAPVPPARA